MNDSYDQDIGHWYYIDYRDYWNSTTYGYQFSFRCARTVNNTQNRSYNNNNQ